MKPGTQNSSQHSGVGDPSSLVPSCHRWGLRDHREEGALWVMDQVSVPLHHSCPKAGVHGCSLQRSPAN